MGDIKVEPSQLETLAGKVREDVGQASGAVADATGKASVSTGAGELDASLGGFTRTWHGQMAQLNEGGNRLDDAIAGAAASYRETDAAAMPAPGAVDGPGGGR